MKIFKYLLFILLATCINAGADECDSCRMKFDVLIAILKQDVITLDDMNNSWQIASELHSSGYYDYVEHDLGKKKYISASLTKTYSDICIRFGGEFGIAYYLKYLDFTSGSAEEERAFALERMFVKYPEALIKRIHGNENLTDLLAWGFVNNRRFGAKNPYENQDYTAMTVHKNSPEPLLDASNCQAIFFETNQELAKKYSKYKNEIDEIINRCIALLR